MAAGEGPRRGGQKAAAPRVHRERRRARGRRGRLPAEGEQRQRRAGQVAAWDPRPLPDEESPQEDPPPVLQLVRLVSECSRDKKRMKAPQAGQQRHVLRPVLERDEPGRQRLRQLRDLGTGRGAGVPLPHLRHGQGGQEEDHVRVHAGVRGHADGDYARSGG